MSRLTATARASDWRTVAIGPINREIAFQSGTQQKFKSPRWRLFQQPASLTESVGRIFFR